MDTIIGLDIGSHTIKLIEIGYQGNTPVLVNAGTITSPPKVVGTSSETEAMSYATAIKKLLSEHGVKSRSVKVALPESQVFTRVIDVPELSRQEFTSAIKWEAEQYIPLPLDQVTMDFTILRDAKETGTNTMQVLLVAAPKTLIDRYVTYLEMAGLGLVGIETEIISASRSLIRSVTSIKTAMVVSLGAQTTDLAILRSGILTFTRSISAGGEALSRALVQGLGFHQNQAEEFKKTYGLDRRHLEGKIVEAVRPIMDTIVSEIRRAVAFYQERYPSDRIDVILLSGGTARLPGMVVYMAEQIGVETQLANPWYGIQMDPRFAGLVNEGPVYSVAVGLALKG
jgi:type IV pilus assembly protein PilM